LFFGTLIAVWAIEIIGESPIETASAAAKRAFVGHCFLVFSSLKPLVGV